MNAATGGGRFNGAAASPPVPAATTVVATTGGFTGGASVPGLGLGAVVDGRIADGSVDGGTSVMVLTPRRSQSPTHAARLAVHGTFHITHEVGEARYETRWANSVQRATRRTYTRAERASWGSAPNGEPPALSHCSSANTERHDKHARPPHKPTDRPQPRTRTQRNTEVAGLAMPVRRLPLPGWTHLTPSKVASRAQAIHRGGVASLFRLKPDANGVGGRTRAG